MFTDSEFHNIGSKNFNINQTNSGRLHGIQKVLQDEFNYLGDYSDAHPKDCNALRFLPKHAHNDLQGAFKTPTLRYLKQTAPYFHDGRFTNLEEVLDHYLNADETITELPELSLSNKEKHQLIAFLNPLN